jgi:hypothetical protein
MVSMPKLTKRAAEQIGRLEAECRQHVPPGNYLSFIGYEVDVEPDYRPNPPFRLHYFFSDASGVPEEFQVEGFGVRVAFNIHERFLAKLQPCVLDFDGARFIFVKNQEAEET